MPPGQEALGAEEQEARTGGGGAAGGRPEDRGPGRTGCDGAGRVGRRRQRGTWSSCQLIYGTQDCLSIKCCVKLKIWFTYKTQSGETVGFSVVKLDESKRHKGPVK